MSEFIDEVEAKAKALFAAAEEIVAGSPEAQGVLKGAADKAVDDAAAEVKKEDPEAAPLVDLVIPGVKAELEGLVPHEPPTERSVSPRSLVA